MKRNVIDVNINIGAPTIQLQIASAGLKIYDKVVIEQFDMHIEKLDWLLGFDVITKAEYFNFKERIANTLNKHLAQFYPPKYS